MTPPLSALIFVTGGARSGKSRFAEEKAQQLGGEQVTYLATAQAFDTEMQERIGRHRADRPASWHTVEEPLEVARVLHTLQAPVVLLDCLSLWVSNAVLRGDSEEMILRAAAELLETQRQRGGTLIAVTNEVGLGIVPDNALARHYRDVLGRVDQAVAAASDEAYLLVSGLPLRLK
ncbi:bifunctional adenosylcobinamide kinase/adenosylcobinamide-phosphate guanylyltransferase [Deinococcus sp. KNUC1210]|uniref:bifunctional adenosylcobinamide kinase/adenosylcobinamide-phosphate guanylyltransferase n=1 Tax=Deinococcus sp. KNUC1210 TaxID=2917691 RepID=UPI001EF07516|nr:bifunctional adenosylcobinamide kinase/adenosylcobinamide-phosphate guanylyltransferase [Deinococcus sp. KNUC1210]ULH15703.1 bifunctional adenosylcobinamide kinase/adenosylcobinamide-phosphate guanylyltransferase [Deinococcus sp. KNUC1210]